MANKKIIVSFAVSIVVVAVLVTMIDWPLVWVELQHAKLLPFVWVTMVWLMHFYIRAIRWQYLLPQSATTTQTQRFNALMVGNCATFILPLRAGEFIRPFFLSRTSDVPFSVGFVSIVLERFFDLVFVLGFFSVVSTYIPGLPQWATDGVRGFSVLAAGIFIFILGAALLPQVIRKITTTVSAYLPKKIAGFGLSLTEQILAGATAIASVKNFSMVVLLSLLVWTTNIIAFNLFLPVVSIPMNFEMSTTLSVLVALAVAAPSAPGFIGIYQVAAIAAFSLYGVPVEKATAYSLLSHLQQYLLIVGVGGFILMRSGLKLSEMKPKRDASQSLPS